MKTVSDILIVLKYIEKRYNYNYKINLISIPKHKYNEMFRLKNHCLSSLDYKEIDLAICLLTGMRIRELYLVSKNQ